jgi:hypothetical protein
MLHQVSIAISNWIHAPKTLEVLGLAAPTPTRFAEFVGNQFPVFHPQILPVFVSTRQ